MILIFLKLSIYEKDYPYNVILFIRSFKELLPLMNKPSNNPTIN